MFTKVIECAAAAITTAALAVLFYLSLKKGDF